MPPLLLRSDTDITAGVGNDPRSSRQFNPIKQANDYDKDNEYVRLWIPELKDVAQDHVQTPWGEQFSSSKIRKRMLICSSEQP